MGAELLIGSLIFPRLFQSSLGGASSSSFCWFLPVFRSFLARETCGGTKTRQATSREKSRQCRTAPASYTVASRNRRAIEVANSYTVIILMPSNRRKTPKLIRIPRREMWCDTFVPSGARITVPTATVTAAGQ